MNHGRRLAQKRKAMPRNRDRGGGDGLRYNADKDEDAELSRVRGHHLFGVFLITEAGDLRPDPEQNHDHRPGACGLDEVVEIGQAELDAALQNGLEHGVHRNPYVKSTPF